MNTKTKAPQLIKLADYTPPDYSVKSLELTIEFTETVTHVLAKSQIFKTRTSAQDLVLDGEQLDLKKVSIDGRVLAAHEYRVDSETLTILNTPAQFDLEIHTDIHPETNTSLSGIYRSSKMFCSQCEPHGFRRITYYLDRSDVLTIFRTTLIAEKSRYPQLLSNGERVKEETLSDGRHSVTWYDPHPKPSYLFAVVASNLALLEDKFTTASGNEVLLQMYVEPGCEHKCGHAIESLKKSMRWDEEKFGREYDLNIFMIVAVHDFNMGAMENKGLNIFNTQYVLADPQTATDQDYFGIESVIAHEYFHNWTGNRVTLRDWFQLSLKEGFTIYRDQEFSCDMNSRGLVRIKEIRYLRNIQFTEDLGPMAHPVRPESYIEINNFYTATVYHKGAELIRMIHVLIGQENFRRASDLYFQRYDGKAVTIEDLIACFENVAKVDLQSFRFWYNQAGTPVLNMQSQYDSIRKTFTLEVKQSLRNPKITFNRALPIPVKMALLDNAGRALPLSLANSQALHASDVLLCSQMEERFEFQNISVCPTPSFLRAFSAPVIVEYEYSEQQLAFLAAHDTDPFNQWEAIQKLMKQAILAAVQHYQANKEIVLPAVLSQVFAKLLSQDAKDLEFLAECFVFPALSELSDWLPDVEVACLTYAWRQVQVLLAQAHDEAFNHHYQVLFAKKTSMGPQGAAERALKNVCLHYLTLGGKTAAYALAFTQYENAQVMTDEFAALSVLSHAQTDLYDKALQLFFNKWQKEALLIDKWFMVQAGSLREDTLERVAKLINHSEFHWHNPNRVRALLAGFARNLGTFHHASGRGYQLLADAIAKLDPKNPQIAARLAGSFSRYARLDEARQKLMKVELQKLLAIKDLSKDTYEIVSKTLG